MPTVAEYIARQTERMGEILANFVATTPQDKQVWHPTMEGAAPTRSVLEQIGECVAVNRRVAAMLRGDAQAVTGGGSLETSFRDGMDAQEQLVASARELAAAIAAMEDAALEETYQMRRGPTTGYNLIMMPYRNMAYHAGQINFIQMLAGDSEFHMPPSYY